MNSTVKGIASVLTKWDLKLTFVQRIRRLIRRLWQWLKNHIYRKDLTKEVHAWDDVGIYLPLKEEE